MSKSFRKDLTGQRFGKLTVLEFVPDENRYAKWKCQCDCGKKTITRGDCLISGDTKSCGCLAKENSIKQGKVQGIKNVQHGQRKTRLYAIWSRMKGRCYNPHDTKYAYYGGRGITVCDEWIDNFQAFYDWSMANGYCDNLTIDRIDVNGDYTPTNCRWTDMKTQCRNTRRNVLVVYNGKTMTIAEAAERSGLSDKTLYSRYYRGERGVRLFRPIRK